MARWLDPRAPLDDRLPEYGGGLVSAAAIGRLGHGDVALRPRLLVGHVP